MEVFEYQLDYNFKKIFVSIYVYRFELHVCISYIQSLIMLYCCYLLFVYPASCQFDYTAFSNLTEDLG